MNQKSLDDRKETETMWTNKTRRWDLVHLIVQTSFKIRKRSLAASAVGHNLHENETDDDNQLDNDSTEQEKVFFFLL